MMKWAFAACLGVLLLIFTSFAAAQIPEPQIITRLVVHHVRHDGFNAFELWNMNSDMTFTPIIDLKDLPKPQLDIDVAPSPDGQHIAYTALTDDFEPLLILISLNPLTVNQYPAPGVASIQWSPTSDALLLSRPGIFMDGDYDLKDGDTYLFDLAAETFTLVAETNDSQIIWQAKWTPSGQDIVFSADIFQSPENPSFDNLFLVSRDGSTPQQLTHLQTEAPQSIDFTQPAPRSYCRINNFKWSSAHVRWYYIMACFAPNDDIIVSSLFSVSLEGDNRLEIDLYEQFPELFDPDTVVGYQVIDFFSNQQSIYMIVNSPNHKVLLIKLNESGQAEIISEIPSKTARLSSVSANGRHIAVSLIGGTSATFNTENNQIQILTPTDPAFTFCRVQWFDDEILLVDEVDLCGIKNTSYIRVAQSIAWNTGTGKITDVTGALDGLNLIIPLPDSAP